MRRKSLIRWVSVIGICILSSTNHEVPTRGWCRTPPARTFWESFDPGQSTKTYEAALQPRYCNGHGTNVCYVDSKMATKHFDFSGVRREERQMAEVLQRLQADMLDRVRASGAKVRGEVRLILERGILRQFEFAYQHHGFDGLVRGRFQPSDGKTGWDRECLVAEDYRPRR